MHDVYWEREFYENPEPAKDLNKDQYSFQWCSFSGMSLRSPRGQISIFPKQHDTKSITYY